MPKGAAPLPVPRILSSKLCRLLQQGLSWGQIGDFSPPLPQRRFLTFNRTFRILPAWPAFLDLRLGLGVPFQFQRHIPDFSGLTVLGKSESQHQQNHIKLFDLQQEFYVLRTQSFTTPKWEFFDADFACESTLCCVLRCWDLNLHSWQPLGRASVHKTSPAENLPTCTQVSLYFQPWKWKMGCRKLECLRGFQVCFSD